MQIEGGLNPWLRIIRWAKECWVSISFCDSMLIFEPIDIFFDFQCRTNVIFFPHFFLLQSLIINIDRLHEWQSFKDKDQSMNLVYHVENHTWRQTCTLMCLDDDSFSVCFCEKKHKIKPIKNREKNRTLTLYSFERARIPFISCLCLYF